MGTSLIKELLDPSHPEIGEFLHLPEITPLIVNEFSRKVVSGCINKLIGRVILELDLDIIEKIVEEFGLQATPEIRQKLQDKQTKVQTYILGLKGIPFHSKRDIDEQWKKVREEELERLGVVKQSVKAKYELSTLSTIAHAILFGIPLWIHTRKKRLEMERRVRETVDERFDGYCQSLDQVYLALNNLNGIETIIQKKEEIYQAIETTTFDLESFESLDRALESQKIRELYGAEEWDRRLDFLKEQLEQVEEDVIPLLYLRCDPSFEVIKVKGDVMHSRKLLRSTGIEENALFFEKKESDLVVVLQRFGDQEEKWDISSEAFKLKHEDFFKAGNRIETINMQTKVAVCGLEKPSSYPMSDALTKLTKRLGMEINTPLSRAFLSAAARDKVRIGRNCFLEKGLIEKSADIVLKSAFGRIGWKKYFGDIGVEPPLPPNIEEILNSECIFCSGKKVRDTHLLVLIPNKVDGKAFHLNSLRDLIKSPKTGNKTDYRVYSDYIKNELGTKSEGSHWALMTRDVIPDSRNKKYNAQKALVDSHASKSGIPYALPTALEAATAILMEHVQTGNRLYGDDPYTYTRCEKVDKKQWPAAIGGFAAGGLTVDHDISYRFDYFIYLGVGCCRKF